MCADRCGIASWPSAATSSARSNVASIPWLGDAVTVTVAPGGSDAGAVQGVRQRDQLELRAGDERAQRHGHLGRDRLRVASLARHRHAPHTFESGKEAFFRSIHSRSSWSTASSIAGGSYSASIFFQITLAR